MKKILLSLFVASLAFTANMAVADIYIGAGANITSLDVNVDTPEDSDTVPSFYVGWKPIKFLALEVGYYDLGAYEVDPGTGVEEISADAFTLAAVGIIPAFMFDFYAKVGYAEASVDSTITGLEEETGAFYALGANVNITKWIDIYLEAQQMTVASVGNSDLDIQLVGAGVRFVF